MGSASDRAKRSIRERARQARREMVPAARAEANAAIAEALLALPEVAEARAVLAYGATREEADPGPALAHLRETGVRIAMVRVDADSRDLSLRWVDDPSELEDGAFGLAQPQDGAPIAPDAVFDVVLVPGVAFDPRGGRLGYGAGYYDRLLPRLREECVSIGVAFDEQVVEVVPVHDHDVPVDVVLTPTRVIRTHAKTG